MRHSMVLVTGLVWTFCFISSATAAIEYHFVPALNGQPAGNSQFQQIAPVVGPSNFKVTVAGAQTGNTPNGSPQTAHAYMDKWGLGVLNPAVGSDKGFTGQVEVDAKNGGEFIRLEFPTAVRLTYLTFASVGSTDQFCLEADGNAIDMNALFPGLTTIKQISKAQGNFPGTVNFPAVAALPFAKSWDVLICGGDGVQLENVGVEPVPEPTTLALWLIGLGVVGLTVLRRRRATGS